MKGVRLCGQSRELMDALMAADATLFQNLTSGHLYVREKGHD
jgi:hypothetical protein